MGYTEPKTPVVFCGCCRGFGRGVLGPQKTPDLLQLLLDPVGGFATGGLEP
jgi:hypothetical protein